MVLQRVRRSRPGRERREGPAENLCAAYREIEVLHGVNLAVEKGQIIALLGGDPKTPAASPELKDAYLGMASGPPHSYPSLGH